MTTTTENHVQARCGASMAKFMDPSGSLQRSGLLIVDDPSEERTITANVIDDRQRMRFLPKHFGRAMMLVESTVYTNASDICPTYQGGYWEYVELSNGGAFMFPRRAEPGAMGIEVEGNGYRGHLSPQAFGILTTMYALSAVSMHVHQGGHEELADQLSRKYHALRDYMLEHEERRALIAAAD